VCGGTGLPTRKNSFEQLPVGLRLVLSVIPVLMLYNVLIVRTPVHDGSHGAILPQPVVSLLFIGVCFLLLYWIWRGTSREDFSLGKNRRAFSLFENPNNDQNSEFTKRHRR
jgi:hypothetical protein